MSVFVARLVSLSLIMCFVGACSSSSTSTTTYDSSGNDTAGGGWFCEMDENGEDWNCVRDESLVRNPQPTRLPSPAPRRVDTPIAAADPDEVSIPERAPAQQPEPPSSTRPAPEPAPQTTQTSPAPDVPKHVRLSYQPRQPVALLDLPQDFWVVQLVSVSSKETLEKYAIDHKLRGMSAARIWSKGQFFYVLILGIYETYDNASEASKDLPPPFDEFPPWIRSVGSLQKAMLEADNQAQGSAS